jgi:hypothetical protein
MEVYQLNRTIKKFKRLFSNKKQVWFVFKHK